MLKNPQTYAVAAVVLALISPCFFAVAMYADILGLTVGFCNAFLAVAGTANACALLLSIVVLSKSRNMTALAAFIISTATMCAIVLYFLSQVDLTSV